MPCSSRYFDEQIEFTPEMFEYLLSRSRNGRPNIQSIQTEEHPRDLRRFISNQAKDKMHNCPYFANSPHLKCTANPTNNNCLECKAYEHHDSNEMDS